MPIAHVRIKVERRGSNRPCLARRPVLVDLQRAESTELDHRLFVSDLEVNVGGLALDGGRNDGAQPLPGFRQLRSTLAFRLGQQLLRFAAFQELRDQSLTRENLSQALAELTRMTLLDQLPQITETACRPC